ncbi:MAG: ABC transporter ATP-binding protein, partial [Nanoarchaeota archaeon]
MMLHVDKLDKHFGGVYAVHNCSFELAKGKITSVIGPNGAGKTTLFNMVSGTIVPDGGSIRFNSKDITGLPAYKIARQGISRTFQLAKVFKNLSVRDNLLLAKQTTDDVLLAALKQVRFTKSLDVLAGELSYGQQRLVELARGLLFPHQLLMLDEPTAGVNPLVRREIAEILRNLRRQGSTIMLIEHDMDFVMGLSDHVIVMNEGTV